MGKRYFCDYCDKTFIDDPESRRKHIQGIGHIRNRNNHYKKFKDVKAIYEEESAKEECRRFRQTGQCQFNENCNFTHYSKEDLQLMKNEIEKAELKSKSYSNIQEASLEDWLAKRRTKSETTTSQLNKDRQLTMKPSTSSYSNHSQLPISLQPVTEDQIFQSDVEFTEWG
ncbi:zinc finger matrin-type protein 5-like [Macrosteles quadrilineatus]|uniref:zinc finger matrin-type protein 5-like n=1 Tax=Macrosteles quadrilineatus TaxID=74068 RepID=UPI0023E2FC2E|nr:zinc finger matrin-type protein 5-like [Macrosteles quadrilineatus]